MRKSWADRQSVPTGVLGEYVNEIEIAESNRVTVYEFFRAGIEILQKILHENYRRKGVSAALFGIEMPSGIGYAIFVNPRTMPDGRLYSVSDNVSEDED